MELEGDNGSRITLQRASTTVLGRGLGFETDDRSVSRKHLLFEVDNGTASGVSFRVLGKNPVWVRSGNSGEIRVYRTSEKGEVGVGDWLCVSAKRPVWFNLKEIEVRDPSKRDSDPESELAEGLESVDVSSIDPVKEFGFLVIGHEFDQYPKSMLRDVKNWNWFLDEPRKGSNDSDDEDEETEGKPKGGRKRKKSKANEDDDDDWTGESEDEDVGNMRKAKKLSYLTRSKDDKKAKPSKSSRVERPSQPKRNAHSRDEDVEDEKNDETLGGFIVDDDDVQEEEEGEGEEASDDEEEEDEFIEDDEDE